MGWQHIMAVFGNTPEISHVALCVLMVLAKVANDKGEGFPSISYIAEKIKLSPRSVKNGLKELKDLGYLEWKSGRGNRHVNKYRITEKVINISGQMGTTCPSNGHHVPFKSAPRAHLNTQMGTTCPSNGHHVPFRSAQGAHGRKEIEDTSKLVSKCPPQNGENHGPVDNSTAGDASSAEEVPVKERTEPRSMAPSAPAMMGKQDYRKLIKEYGWKPTTREAVEEIVRHGYKMGLSVDEAKKFVRYNNIRKWDAVSMLVSVHQLVKEWLDSWKKKSRGEFESERQRREEEKRQAEIARQRAIVEAERNG